MPSPPPSSSSDCPYPIVSDSNFVASVTSPSSTSVTSPDSAIGFAHISDCSFFVLPSVSVISCSTWVQFSRTVLSASSSLDDDNSLVFVSFRLFLSNCQFAAVWQIFQPCHFLSTSFAFVVFSRLSAMTLLDKMTEFPLFGKIAIVFLDSYTLLTFLFDKVPFSFDCLVLSRIRIVESASSSNWWFGSLSKISQPYRSPFSTQKSSLMDFYFVFLRPPHYRFGVFHLLSWSFFRPSCFCVIFHRTNIMFIVISFTKMSKLLAFKHWSWISSFSLRISVLCYILCQKF